MTGPVVTSSGSAASAFASSRATESSASKSTRAFRCNVTPAARSWSARRSATAGFKPLCDDRSRAPAWNSVTSLPGYAKEISPASSTPTGPPPTMAMRSALCVVASAAWYLLNDAAVLTSSSLAGNPAWDPVATTRTSAIEHCHHSSSHSTLGWRLACVPKSTCCSSPATETTSTRPSLTDVAVPCINCNTPGACFSACATKDAYGRNNLPSQRGTTTARHAATQ